MTDWVMFHSTYQRGGQFVEPMYWFFFVTELTPKIVSSQRSPFVVDLTPKLALKHTNQQTSESN